MRTEMQEILTKATYDGWLRLPIDRKLDAIRVVRDATLTQENATLLLQNATLYST